jgi:tRNA(Ile)-lysidine synthase
LRGAEAMLLKKVKQAIRKYRLIDKGDVVLVGVSGGPDSSALLYLLNSLRKELGFTLHIAHLDHKIRKESYKDREFVQELSRRLKLPITTAEIDVKDLLPRGSIEEKARHLRFNFLFKTAATINATKIALGHNQDDQAETVLMRILRGTGLYGLGAISIKRKIEKFIVIRPLLEIKRTEIEAYLRRKHIKPCLDVSNSQDIYFRNKVRNRLLPLLQKEYNKNIKHVLVNLAESAGDDYDYLYREAMRAVRRLIANPGRKQISFNLNKFIQLHPAMARLVLRFAIARMKGDTRRLTFRHIKEIEELLHNRPVGSIVNLPKGIYVVKKKNRLFLRSTS